MPPQVIKGSPIVPVRVKRVFSVADLKIISATNEAWVLVCQCRSRGRA